jgi:hypothetical protein
MPAFPVAYVDDVADGVQRDYHAARGRMQLAAEAAVSADRVINVQQNQNFVADTRLQGAVVAQALLGSDPALANETLAANSVARQPWDAPVNPVSGPGQNPTGGVKTGSGTTTPAA